MRKTAKKVSTVNEPHSPYFKERREAKTLWQRFKRWLSRRAQDWRRFFRAFFETSGVVMGAYSFFRYFGLRPFMLALALGAFLSPIESGE